MDHISKVSMIKIVKEHIGFRYLLIEMQLYTSNSFGSEYIFLEVLNKIKDESITHNIFRIEDNESIMCEFYCITFIAYMLAIKTLSDYTNLFFPNEKIIHKYFKHKYGRRSKSGI